MTGALSSAAADYAAMAAAYPGALSGPGGRPGIVVEIRGRTPHPEFGRGMVVLVQC